MCSVQEEGIPAPEKLSGPSLENACCTKCREPAVIIIRVDHTFCGPCFLSYATHKFRSTFGKSRLVRDGEKVMVAFSGGNCSTALLHLCLEGKSPRAAKKLRFQPSLVYIDEGAVSDNMFEERQTANQPILEVMEKSGLPCYVYHLEQSLGTDSVVGSSHSTSEQMAEALQQSFNPDAAEQLRSLLNAAKTLTAKENLVHTLRQRLLVHSAAVTGHTKILLGDSCTRLSIRLLSCITQGRGAHVAHELAFGDQRFRDVMILRPLREFLSKEIAMYNRLQKLDVTVLPNLATKTAPGASLDRLTEQFLCGLQAEFPATVSTVFRTGTKLDPGASAATADPESACLMCQSTLDTRVPECSALTATQFSWSLSHKNDSANQKSTVRGTNKGSVEDTANQKSCCDTSGDHNSTPECCGEGDGSCHDKHFVLQRSDLESLLCYGCRLVIKDVSDISLLPGYITEEAGQTLRRNQARESIQEFLLDES